MTDIAKLGLEVDSGQVKTADRDLKRFGKTSKTTGRKVQTATEKMNHSFTRLRGQVNRSGVAFVALGAAVAGTTAAVLASTLETQDSIGKMAQQLGISTEALSELQFAAEQTGSSATQLSAGLETMSKRLGQVATTGTGEAQKALDALGLSATRLTDLEPDVAFQQIATAMGDLESQSGKNAIAAQIFSRANQSLVNTLGLTEEQMQDLRGEARALGRSLSEEQTQAAADALDAMNSLKSALTGVSNTMATALAPAITAIANGLTDDLSDGMESSRQDVLDWGQTYGDTIALIADVGASSLGVLKYAFASLGSALGASAAQLGALLGGEFDQVLTIQRLYMADQEKLNAELLSTNTTRYRDELAAVLAHNKEMNEARTGGLDTITVNAPLIEAPLTPAPRTASQEVERQIIDVPGRIGISTQGDRDREALQSITDSLRTQEERIQQSYDRRTEIVLRAVDDQEKQKAMLAGLDAQRLTSLEQLSQNTYDNMSVFSEQARRNIQDELGDTLSQTLRGDFDGIGEAWSNMIIDMAAQAQAAQLGNALFGKKDSDGDGLLGTLGGMAISGISSYFGGVSSASAGQSLADAGIGGASFGVPRYHSGGIVGGSGDVPAVLKGGEGVFTPQQMGKLAPAGGGSETNVIVENHIGPAKVEQRKEKGPNGRDQVRVILKAELANMVGSGEMDQVMSPFGRRSGQV